MARTRRPPDTPSLFDLPLAPEPGPPEEVEPLPEAPRAVGGRTAGRSPEEVLPPAGGRELAEEVESGESPGLPLFADGTTGPVAAGRSGLPEAEPAAAAPSLADRLRAGLADLALHAAVGLALLVGAELLGARPGLAELPALGLFLVVFSFFYTVVPLAFWGKTPGMGWSGLVVRAEGDQPITLGQTSCRWLGALLTVALLGLPALLALGGRSLGDRLSGTDTRRAPRG